MVRGAPWAGALTVTCAKVIAVPANRPKMTRTLRGLCPLWDTKRLPAAVFLPGILTDHLTLSKSANSEAELPEFKIDRFRQPRFKASAGVRSPGSSKSKNFDCLTQLSGPAGPF